MYQGSAITSCVLWNYKFLFVFVLCCIAFHNFVCITFRIRLKNLMFILNVSQSTRMIGLMKVTILHTCRKEKKEQPFDEYMKNQNLNISVLHRNQKKLEVHANNFKSTSISRIMGKFCSFYWLDYIFKFHKGRILEMRKK